MDTPTNHEAPDHPPLSVSKVFDLGLVAEINRRVLHPVGIAMGLTLEGRVAFYDANDEEGWNYEEPFDDTLIERVGKFADLEAERFPAREAALGYIVQPVPAR